MMEKIGRNNTFSQIHIQYVFAVKYRRAMIERKWKERLHQYITALVQDKKHKMLQVNSMPDHLHLLVGLRPYQSISSLIQHVKTQSSIWINENKLCVSEFNWQEGYGAFSYSKSQVDNVIRYIQNQEIHHKKETFLEEYKRILRSLEIEFDEKYLFKPLT
jgi:putative transposase